MRFVPDDEVWGDKTVESTTEGIDTADVDGVGCPRPVCRDVAMVNSCEGEGGGRLRDEEVSVADEPGAFATLGRSSDHERGEGGLARAGWCLDEYRAIRAEFVTGSVDQRALIFTQFQH